MKFCESNCPKLMGQACDIVTIKTIERPTFAYVNLKVGHHFN